VVPTPAPATEARATGAKVAAVPISSGAPGSDDRLPQPTLPATGIAGTDPLTAPDTPAAEPVSIRLADEADFVAQYRGYWCVGASLQMAQAIITGERNESRRTQRRYWQAARARSPTSPYNGANPIGWTAALNDLGLGPYRLVSRPTLEAAVRTAARAMARTGKPVGLVVWAGHHAWVMTGFEASGDPGVDAGATITALRVMDPLYPNTEKRWGRAPAPESLVDMDALARQYVRRHRPDYPLGVPSGWLLILPTG
jgi:hypothetical protein